MNKKKFKSLKVKWLFLKFKISEFLKQWIENKGMSSNNSLKIEK